MSPDQISRNVKAELFFRDRIIISTLNLCKPPKNSARPGAERKRRRREINGRSRIEGRRAWDEDLVKAEPTDTGGSWIAAVMFVIYLARLLQDFLAPVLLRLKIAFSTVFRCQRTKSRLLRFRFLE